MIWCNVLIKKYSFIHKLFFENYLCEEIFLKKKFGLILFLFLNDSFTHPFLDSAGIAHIIAIRISR